MRTLLSLSSPKTYDPGPGKPPFQSTHVRLEGFSTDLERACMDIQFGYGRWENGGWHRSPAGYESLRVVNCAPAVDFVTGRVQNPSPEFDAMLATPVVAPSDSGKGVHALYHEQLFQEAIDRGMFAGRIQTIS